MASPLSTCLFVLLFIVVITANKSSKTYKAAVVEYEPYIGQRVNPTDFLLENAKRYTEYVTKAAQENAIVVVFPEYGIVTLEGDENSNGTREFALAYTQTVPDPKQVSWNPCLNPTDYTRTEVLHVLSCSARNNTIAILANLLSSVECNKENDPNCPSEGFYLYNTNVVFDKTGKLIGRYYKHHLFDEPILNSPKQTEYVTFNIEGIEFASFICFDIMYKDPAVEFVRDKGIKNLIFSTAWGNEMPFLLGPEVYSRWARGLGANLIVSNYYKPQYSRLGSGIYSSQLGALNETFDISRKGRLLTADLPINPSPVPEESQCLPPMQSHSDGSTNDKTNTSHKPFIMTDKPSSGPVDPINTIFYQQLINFTAHYLEESQGNINLCQNDTCCNLVYNLTFNNDLGVYALMAFDGIHPYGRFRMGMQACSVMRCENDHDIESCGRVPKTAAVAEFDKFSLTAQLEADVVFPSVVKDDLQLLSAEDWSFSIKNCEGKKSQSKIELNTEEKSIIIASLYARLYDRDYEVMT